jgi:hypothetical protein
MTTSLPTVPQMANRAMDHHRRIVLWLAAGNPLSAMPAVTFLRTVGSAGDIRGHRKVMLTLMRWEVVERVGDEIRLTERGRALAAHFATTERPLDSRLRPVAL